MLKAPISQQISQIFFLPLPCPSSTPNIIYLSYLQQALPGNLPAKKTREVGKLTADFNFLSFKYKPVVLTPSSVSNHLLCFTSLHASSITYHTALLPTHSFLSAHNLKQVITGNLIAKLPEKQVGQQSR